jgi:hypothetical protein
MPELLATQHCFGAALADPARADDAAQLIAGDADRARRRIGIYRGNMIANATTALAAAYPIIGKLVGEEFFDGLARAYCRAHPSLSGDLNECGAQFAEFLAAFPHAQSLPYLCDVARLEWLAHRAHYAADHAPLDTGRLGQIAESAYPTLELKLHPAVSTLESPYPVYRIWEVHQDDYCGEITVDLDSGAQRVIVYRPGFRVTVALLSRGELAFLNAIKDGERLGAALENALAADTEFNLGVSLQRWIAANIVVDLSLETSEIRHA